MGRKDFVRKYFQKYYAMPMLVKASMWFAMSTVLLKGISFVTVPIFTRIMTTDQYGLYSVYLTWTELFTIIGSFGLESCAYVSALTKYEGADKEEAQLSLLELAFTLTSVLMGVVLCFGDVIANVIGLPKQLLMLMVLQIYFIPALNFWTMRQRFRYKYKSLVVVSISMSVLNAATGVLFVINVTDDSQALARILSIVMIQAVYGCFLFYHLQKGKRLFISVKYWKWGIKLHIPLLSHMLSLKILAGSDRIMINAIVGMSATAIYSVSHSVAVVVNLVKTSIVEAMRPWIYNCLKEENMEDIKSVTNGVLLLVSLLTLVFIAFAPEVIWIVAPANYYEAIYCMPPVMISSFFTFLYSVFSTVEMYYEETKKIMAASVLAAIINVVLNAIFISLYGYIAAAYTTLICYMFLALFHAKMVKEVMKKHDVKTELFDRRMIIIVSSVLIILMLVFEYLYTNIFYRYLFLSGVLVFMYIRRKYFIGIVRALKKK